MPGSTTSSMRCWARSSASRDAGSVKLQWRVRSPLGTPPGRVVSRGSQVAQLVYVVYTFMTMMPSDLLLIASLATVSRHGCLRRAALARGNRYIVRAVDRAVKHAA